MPNSARSRAYPPPSIGIACASVAVTAPGQCWEERPAFSEFSLCWRAARLGRHVTNSNVRALVGTNAVKTILLDDIHLRSRFRTSGGFGGISGPSRPGCRSKRGARGAAK